MYMYALCPITFGTCVYQLSSQNQDRLCTLYREVGWENVINQKNMDGYITKIRKISWLPRQIPSLEHETLPLSLGQHKAKTQPRQLTNMIADVSRLPHSSFDSSQLLPIIPINSTFLSPRPTKKRKKKTTCRDMDPQCPPLLLLFLLRSLFCAKYT